MLLRRAGPKQNGKSLKTSTRSLILLKDFGLTGERLDLPPTCQIEFPEADINANAETSAEKYKRFIVHFAPDEGLYSGGVFRVEFSVKDVPEYPHMPPKARTLTQIWHPNIDLKGNICHNFLKVDQIFGSGAGYTPALKMSGVVMGVLTLFYGEENPDDPLNLEAAQQYKTNREAFNKKATDWTRNYAKRVEIPPHCLAAS